MNPKLAKLSTALQGRSGRDDGPGLGQAPSAIATAFVEARLAARPLEGYPGQIPDNLDAAYAIQDQAIDLWPDEIAGWKIGRITGVHEEILGEDRLAGPIFSRSIRHVKKPGFVRRLLGAPRYQLEDMPVFDGGFAAIEGEVIFILSQDAPAEKMQWSTEDAKALIGSAVAGIEVASSPFSGINDLGPLVTISDFGNNNGLIVGEPIPGWRQFKTEDWKCETRLDGELIGTGAASLIPGGPVESLRFLAENCARRGRPLKKDMFVSTGAVTGVHQAAIGQTADVCFTGLKGIRCALVPVH